MKKQYLIGLLGLVAISIPFGNSFLTINSSPSNITTDKISEVDSSNSANEYLEEYPNYSIEEISMGAKHSAAVVNDGVDDHLYTWGRNNYGQLGLGNVSGFQFNTPQEVTGLPDGDIEQISMGYDYSAAVVSDETGDHLYTWGLNDHGQLGINDKKDYNTPQEVNELPAGEIEQISTGVMHSAAVISDGTGDHLYTWGDNNDDQLGLGDEFNGYNYDTPQEVKEFSNSNIEQISMGDRHSSLVVSENDSDHLYTWGRNDNGQLGLGDEFQDQHYNTPQEVITLPDGDVKQIETGDYYSGAIVTDENGDHLYTWGLNYRGQLGLGYDYEEYNYNTPQEVTGLPDGEIEQVSMGEEHTSVVVNDGTSDHLYTWGNNYDGQLGLGSDYYWWNYDYPKEVELLPAGEIEQISMGDKFSAAVVNDGKSDSIYTWGLNDFGQLGLGDDIKHNTPQEMQAMPYVNNVNSNAISNENNPKEIKIEYDFETNLNVQNVDVSVYQTTAGEDNKETISTTPDYLEKNKYEGKAEFDNISLNVDYTYTINLDYLTSGNVLKTINLDQGNFSNDGTIESIIEESQPVVVTSPTEAIVSYEVTPGKDLDGENVSVTDVKWMNGSQELASSTATKNIMTTDKLIPYNTYNGTTLVATMSDGTTTVTNVAEFQADSGEVTSTVKQDGPVVVTSTTGANVDYIVNPGKEKNGNDVEVTSVRWMNGDTEIGKSLTNDNEGSITTIDLKPHATYSNTAIVASMSDGTLAIIGVDEFTMDYSKTTTIEQTGEVVVTSPTSAVATYKINPAVDADGKKVYAENVQWMNGEDELASSIAISGTLITEDLKPNTVYDSTIIIATMNDGSTATTDVNSFDTKTTELEPEIQTPDAIKIDCDNDILQVQGSIVTNGSIIKDIYFVDNNGKEIKTTTAISEVSNTKTNDVEYDVWTSEYVEEEPAEGEPHDLTNYSLEVEYETTAGTTTTTATTPEYSAKVAEQAIEEDLNYLLGEFEEESTDPTKTGGWAIFGIIVGSLLLVGIIGYGFYYLFNKNKTTKA